MGYHFVTQGDSGWTVSAEITYTTGPEVTVHLIENTIGWNWAIRGSKNNPDRSERVVGNGIGYYYFEASDGEELAFQVVNQANNNQYTNGDVFTINFSDSGGGGGDYTPSYNTLYVNQGKGTKITVIRTWSDYGECSSSAAPYPGDGIMFKDGVMYDNKIWYGTDYFEIGVEVEDGYQLDYYTIDGKTVGFKLDNFTRVSDGEFLSGGRYTLSIDGSATITTTASPIHGIHIDDGVNDASFNLYHPYIYSEYTKYLDKGTISGAMGSSNSSIYNKNDGTKGWASNEKNSTEYGDQIKDDSDYLSTTYIAFTINNLIGRSKSITLTFEFDSWRTDEFSDDIELYYALSLSGKDNKYITVADSVDDDLYQIHSGVLKVNSPTKTVTINTTELTNNKYYVYLWPKTGYIKVWTQPPGQQTYSIEYEYNPVLSYKYNRYIPYIDNGTSWEPL